MAEDQEWNRLRNNMTKWLSVDVRITEKYRDIAMDFALSIGGLAIVESKSTFQVSYSHDESGQLALKELGVFLKELDPESSAETTVVKRTNWNKEWQSYFNPSEISEELIILPEWENPDEFTHRVKTRIRPAMAFGTGTHETTQLCLQLLEKVTSHGDHVLDIGTGSGILGITALHLGAAHIDAIENDPLVEENVQDNLALNEIPGGFNLQISETPKLNAPYDLMVVNIIRAKLFPILPNYFNSVKESGKVIISGLLEVEDAELRSLLSQSPWNILDSYTNNEWIAYLCEVK